MNLPTAQELNNIDMTRFAEHVDDFYLPYFFNEAGKEHYRLLSWMGLQFTGPIYDIGTHRGMSALALSNLTKHIITYDIVSHVIRPTPNVEYRVKNPVEDIDEISKAALIVYDTSHDGVAEREFFSALSQTDFRGTILFDDIHLNEPMELFWNDLIYPNKRDITHIGHGSGTGLLVIE
jgi:hypothetical protein